MNGVDWTLTIAGLAVVLLTLVDVALTVLHLDLDGPLARVIHRVIWRVCVGVSRLLPRFRRALLTLAAPIMMAATFVAWTGLYMTGFALVVWPHLGLYRADDEQGTLSAIDAFYFSGVTASVLGYGDITPLTAAHKVLAVVESGLGFALLTCVVTWLINVISAVGGRNALALRVRQETESTGDGVRLIERCWKDEDTAAVHMRLQSLVQSAQQLLPKMHQFPIIDLYYRAYDPRIAPERMTLALAQAVMAAQVLMHNPPHPRLRVVVSDLHLAVLELMQLLADQYLPAKARDALRQKDPPPGQIDYDTVQTIHNRLRGHADETPLPPEAVQFAYRLRVWLEAMDQLTGWRMDAAEIEL